MSTTVQACLYCGETALLNELCAGCMLTRQEAEAKVEIHLRHVEHQRRSRLVVVATEGMPMRERIRAAKHLLGDLGPLPTGEPWDRKFREWQGSLRDPDEEDR